jgi:hypothetical protein
MQGSGIGLTALGLVSALVVFATNVGATGRAGRTGCDAEYPVAFLSTINASGVAGADVGVGADGTVWAAGVDGKAYRFNGDGLGWSADPAAANVAHIDVGPDGLAWVVTYDGGIWHDVAPGKWTKVPGAAVDVGVGADQSVWIVGPDGNPARYDGASWRRDEVRSNAVRIDVAPDGRPWVVTNAHTLYRLGAKGWTLVSRAPPAVDVGINQITRGPGAPYVKYAVAGTDGGIYSTTNPSGTWSRELEPNTLRDQCRYVTAAPGSPPLPPSGGPSLGTRVSVDVGAPRATGAAWYVGDHGAIRDSVTLYPPDHPCDAPSACASGAGLEAKSRPRTLGEMIRDWGSRVDQ